jgi:large subunit ribosomal protein L16
MGSGKGAVEYWVVVIKPGNILFEITGVPRDIAMEALRIACYKLPIKTKILIKEETTK